MVFLWFSYGFPMVVLWFSMICSKPPTRSYGFPMVFLWLSYGFPMVVLWFSYGFPMAFLWLSYGFPMVVLWFSMICSKPPTRSYGFPMVFLWFSYGCPMVVLWLSYGFPMVFLWFSYGCPMVSMICSKAPGKHCEHIGMGMDRVGNHVPEGPKAWGLVMPSGFAK